MGNVGDAIGFSSSILKTGSLSPFFRRKSALNRQIKLSGKDCFTQREKRTDRSMDEVKESSNLPLGDGGCVSTIDSRFIRSAGAGNI